MIFLEIKLKKWNKSEKNNAQNKKKDQKVK